MFENIIHSFRRWKTQRKKSQEYDEVDQLVSRFQVKENNGHLYLMCDGIPYEKLQPNLTAQEISQRISLARHSAYDYKRNRTNVAKDFTARYYVVSE